MKIEYSKEMDALYIIFKDAKIVESGDIDEGITIDIDESGHVVGIEILDASEKIDNINWLNIGKELASTVI
jgi:uncharacterized protein YuzE